MGAEKVVRHPVRDSGSSFPVPILDFTPLITDRTQLERVTETDLSRHLLMVSLYTGYVKDKTAAYPLLVGSPPVISNSRRTSIQLLITRINIKLYIT